MFLFVGAVRFIKINCCGLPYLSSADMVVKSDILKKLSWAAIVAFAVIFLVFECPSADSMRFNFKRKDCGSFVTIKGFVFMIAVRLYRSKLT